MFAGHAEKGPQKCCKGKNGSQEIMDTPLNEQWGRFILIST
jgi:hypothetical protein